MMENVLKRLKDGTPLSDTDEVESDNTFESGNWIAKVKEIVIATGKELYGKGADYAFPLLRLASYLDGK